ncbi:unnamed protein product [Durusdinium trenchii]|uniref:Uncharacterized protein n=2 Tax=Durusdinium trenchii TaxID=1381693 RepID=A0ABP0HFW9_9DINO
MGNVIYPMWAECPMLTRMVIVGYPAMSMVFLMLASVSDETAWFVDSLFNCNLDNLMSGKLWTLFWGPFYMPIQSGMAFLMILLELYMAMRYFPSYEKEYGSTGFLCWTFFVNMLNSLVFLAFTLCTVLYYHQSGNAFGEFVAKRSAVHGLWPLVMVCLTLTALSDPDGSTNFWGMVTIPNRWYPLALTGFFMLLNGFRIMWSLIAALVTGYAFSRFRFERFLPSKPRLDRLEQRCCRGGRCNLLGASWVPANSTSSFDVDVQVDRRYQNFSDFGNERTNQTAPSGGGQFVAFGGSGNRLGESTEMAQAPSSAAESNA